MRLRFFWLYGPYIWALSLTYHDHEAEEGMVALGNQVAKLRL